MKLRKKFYEWQKFKIKFQTKKLNFKPKKKFQAKKKKGFWVTEI